MRPKLPQAEKPVKLAVLKHLQAQISNAFSGFLVVCSGN